MTAKKPEVSIPMSLLSFSKSVDRGSYEKLSIRDSARSLKKYGSTSSKSATKNESYSKHFVSNSDTLQGIALRYNVTIEQIRRANKLWASDSLFLREFLLIPQSDNANDTLTMSPSAETQSTSSQCSLVSPTSVENLNQNRMSTASSCSTRSSFDEENISDFLSKIDASIASTKEVVRKVTSSSEFGTDLPTDQRRRPQARLKQQQNNNDVIPPGPPPPEHRHSTSSSEHRLSNSSSSAQHQAAAAPLNTVVTVHAQGQKVWSKSEVRLNTLHTTPTYTWPRKRKVVPRRIWQHWIGRAGGLKVLYVMIIGMFVGATASALFYTCRSTLL